MSAKGKKILKGVGIAAAAVVGVAAAAFVGPAVIGAVGTIASAGFQAGSNLFGKKPAPPPRPAPTPGAPEGVTISPEEAQERWGAPSPPSGIQFPTDLFPGAPPSEAPPSVPSPGLLPPPSGEAAPPGAPAGAVPEAPSEAPPPERPEVARAGIMGGMGGTLALAGIGLLVLSQIGKGGGGGRRYRRNSRRRHRSA